MSDCRFWIVTPSFNSRSWLPCAVASVADQAGEGICVHHHVQDGGSSDGTCEWLEAYAKQHPAREGYTFSYESAADSGMYDAINKGWALAPEGTDFLGHLNSDEQYLPGALREAAIAFERHPAWEVVLADMVVIDSGGQYVCHRRSLRLSKLVFRYTTGGMTAATFQRHSVFKQRGICFETSWRVIADKVWYHQMAQAGVVMGCHNAIVSAFAETGGNLAWSPAYREEGQRYASRFMGGQFWPLHCLSKWNGLRRIVKEWFHQPPSSYAIYTRENPGMRREFPVAKPTVSWGKKKLVSQT